ncbi:hypothetical protein C8C85_0527 [Flavobacterium sp. 103]|uniref:LIC_10190 family membrane protein n=2 Tax=unclassified Flavobacterium TaxID=196869 RepID=UPI000D5CCDB3|nr:hypothetical protein [Flavobacterium sp. 103]PVX44776.1 hypothetical protein C8C85_0527 [Flavobacterium sp. 103]
MILILLSWIYIFFSTINLGFVTDRILRLKNQNFVIHTILGLFTTTIFTSISAIFGRVNIEFHIVLLLINLAVFFKFQKEIRLLYKLFLEELRSLTTPLKIVLSIITILILAQCASIPYILDNESYYIQTIKWINEYGFVKGLANLHFFLAQTSGWHILQSAYSFSFLYDKFNDISGFCLLLGNIFAITKLNDYFKNKDENYLIIGLLPLANVFFFQFISSPSPDIPIYIFSLIIFFYFLQNFKKLDVENFNLIVILILFSLFIKTTSFSLIFIPILLLAKNFKKLLPELFKSVLISIIILVLFVIKNTIISGFPFFPVINFHFLETDYRIPETIAKLYYEETRLYGYFLTHEQYDKMTVYDLFLRWLTLPKLHGLFNKLSIILIITSPIFIYKYFHKKEIWTLYFIMCLHFTFLFCTSPQYRFFMNFLLFFSFFLTALFLKQKRIVLLSLYFSIFITGFVLLMPINLYFFTKNKFALSTSNFSTKNIIFPYKNTKSSTTFEYLQNGNLNFYSPVENDFFWSSGDGKLPCVNKNQIQYFNYYYKVKPQMRTTDLKDGFYSKSTSKE